MIHDLYTTTDNTNVQLIDAYPQSHFKITITKAAYGKGHY
jgi:hypothetical protein